MESTGEWKDVPPNCQRCVELMGDGHTLSLDPLGLLVRPFGKHGKHSGGSKPRKSTDNHWRWLRLVECSGYPGRISYSRVRKEYAAHKCGGNAGTVHSEGAERCEPENKFSGLKDVRPALQGASRYAATWETTSSGKGLGLGLGVVVHTQARALLFRVERLPFIMRITSTVYL